MLNAKFPIRNSLAALATAIVAHPALAADVPFDSASLEVGAGDQVRMVRFGVQSEWQKKWFVSNGTHVSGYWDLSLAQWRGNRHRDIPGAHQNIMNLGFTPVFRFQADNKRGWYAEGGIGLNLMSKRYNNDGKEFSTRFQFGDHIGAGFVFANGWDIGLKVQHFSNGGYKKPNPGVDFALLRASRSF